MVQRRVRPCLRGAPRAALAPHPRPPHTGRRGTIGFVGSLAGVTNFIGCVRGVELVKSAEKFLGSSYDVLVSRLSRYGSLATRRGLRTAMGEPRGGGVRGAGSPISVGQLVRSRSPVTSATSPPSRTSPSAFSGGDHVPAGSSAIAWRMISPIVNPKL